MHNFSTNRLVFCIIDLKPFFLLSMFFFLLLLVSVFHLLVIDCICFVVVKPFCPAVSMLLLYSLFSSLRCWCCKTYLFAFHLNNIKFTIGLQLLMASIKYMIPTQENYIDNRKPWTIPTHKCINTRVCVCVKCDTMEWCIKLAYSF